MPKPLKAHHQEIIDLRQQGYRPVEIMRRTGVGPAVVYACLRNASSRHGVVLPRLYPKSTRWYVRLLIGRGALTRWGNLADIAETLTGPQVDELLARAPRANTFAEAIAVFLAEHLPEKKQDDRA